MQKAGSRAGSSSALAETGRDLENFDADEDLEFSESGRGDNSRNPSNPGDSTSKSREYGDPTPEWSKDDETTRTSSTGTLQESHSPSLPRVRTLQPVLLRTTATIASEVPALHDYQPPQSDELPPRKGSVSAPTSGPTSLPPCPRSMPITAYSDWYTIRDMTHLKFCPSCTQFLGSTRFRDCFIPDFTQDPTKPISCAMSLPWIRIAWLQSIKQGRSDLQLLRQISTAPLQGTKPCAGLKSDLRKWFHLTDPRTKEAVENFDICSACMRHIALAFPGLQNLFERPPTKLVQEKICNLNTTSRNFLPIMGELEKLAGWQQSGQLGEDDLHNFVDFVRRNSRHRPCMRDAMLGILLWHYIPDIPEFTICEQCFEEVVFPLRDLPIARDVSKTLQLVTGLRRSGRLPGISCQLYSDRMRNIFQHAVSDNDIESLKEAARYRYAMEHRLQEIHKQYEMDQSAGIDRRAEMEKNIALWMSIE